MPKYIYDKCPIKEAIFEIHFAQAGWDNSVPGLIWEKIGSKYPHKKDIHRFAFIIGSQPSQGNLPPVPVIQMRSEDGNKILQVGPGIITANIINYSAWEDFKPSIMDILAAYLEVANPKIRTKILMRYINQFVFDSQEIDLAQYFNLNIKLPPVFEKLGVFNIGLGSEIGSAGVHNQQVQVTFASDLQFRTHSPYKSAFVLDISCYTQKSHPVELSEIIDNADHLHTSVSNIFESFLLPDLRNHLGAKPL